MRMPVREEIENAVRILSEQKEPLKSIRASSTGNGIAQVIGPALDTAEMMRTEAERKLREILAALPGAA